MLVPVFTPRSLPSRVFSPRALPRVARTATFARSLGLLRSFPDEQARPDIFYGNLAEDTATLITNLAADVCGWPDLGGKRILDVGGGPGYFAESFAARGARYLPVEPDASEMSAAGLVIPGRVRADGRALPFKTDAFDVTYSSNVVEHVADPWRMADEMLRVTKPGGLVVISYTVWLGPFGGHETGLLPHYLGGHYARRRYERTHGHPPKNVFGESLFNVSCAQAIRWAEQQPGVAAIFPRYHPSWAWWITRIPVLREFGVSNCVIVLRKP